MNYLVTRSHKWNEKHHGGDATASIDREPDWFGSKAGNVDSDPKKVKKDGGGKANWGRSGDEALDYDIKPRRRSNSFVDHTKDFKSKFETVEAEPMFDEHIHGASAIAEEEDMASLELDKASSASSGTSSIESIEEGDEGLQG